MPDYRLQVFASSIAASGGGGVGNLVAEFDEFRNLGYATYINDVGEAFFTLSQEDAKALSIRSWMPHYHLKAIRDNEVVWRGTLGEYEATDEDLVVYAYGYGSKLYTLQSGWNQTWTSATIGTIVSDQWTRAKTDISYSPLGFVTTGTIQAPVTTSGGATAITLPSYKVYYKRILFEIRELVALGVSDTTNTVFHEFAFTNSMTDNAVTFNFWKNKSTDQTAIRWEYGGQVRAFVDRFAAVNNRNDIFAVGSGSHNLLFRVRQQQATGTFGYQTIGRHQEPIYLSWVRDQDDVDRVSKLRAKKALRTDVDLMLFAHANAITPIGATGANHALGDRVKVKIDEGATQVDKYLQVQGEQVLVIRGAEHVRPLLADRNS